tara:strand:+ start:1904 stop:2110 length:207 start_codon:yes stop_codon:yes gene_type:complete
MKIKLKNKDKPMTTLFCFNRLGFCQTTFDKINSGIQVKVERVPKKAWDYVEEIKKQNKKKKNKKEGEK